jgi:dTDP-4-amino-4,6-dideoxygalactose transaminase
LRIAIPAPHIRHAYYKFYAYVRPETLKSDWNRDRILDELTALGIPCGSGSCSEIYLEKAFTRSQLSLPQRLPVAKELGETSMMFLVHPTLSDTMVADMAQTVADVVQDATR